MHLAIDSISTTAPRTYRITTEKKEKREKEKDSWIVVVILSNCHRRASKAHSLSEAHRTLRHYRGGASLGTPRGRGNVAVLFIDPLRCGVFFGVFFGRIYLQVLGYYAVLPGYQDTGASAGPGCGEPPLSHCRTANWPGWAGRTCVSAQAVSLAHCLPVQPKVSASSASFSSPL